MGVEGEFRKELVYESTSERELMMCKMYLHSGYASIM